MKKLKLSSLQLSAKDVLTREQLKNVYGGSGGSGGSGEETCNCNSRDECASGEQCFNCGSEGHGGKKWGYCADDNGVG